MRFVIIRGEDLDGNGFMMDGMPRGALTQCNHIKRPNQYKEDDMAFY
jgi:hypothetical protein